MSGVLETRGDYRVRIELDPYPDEPYDDGQSPLMRISYGSYGYRAGHIMATGRPLDADSYAEEAVARWGTDFALLEKYLRAYHGATQVITWHSGDYWYVSYDTAQWRAAVGASPESVNMDEYRAYVEGDVYYWIVEKRVTWHADSDEYPDRDTWETVDSCGGYYGYGDYLEQSARDALDYAANPAPGAEAISPERLAAALEDMRRVQRNLDQDREQR